MKKGAMFFIMAVVVLLIGCLACVPGQPVRQSPVINSFDVEPASISQGESATLSWDVSGATKVSIEPDVGSIALRGRRMVSPAVTTTYTLTAANEIGTVTATVRVIVATAPPVTPPTPTGLPVINSFAANPGSISPGGSSTLSWHVSGATSVTISGVGSAGLSGSTSVSPAVTTAYTLTASNAAGSVTATTQVIVTVPPPAADTTPPSVPGLMSPASGVVLPQKTVPWSFAWSASSDPESGVKQYHIQVYRAGQPPFIEDYIPTTSYSKTVEVAYGYLSNWRWRVRAQNNVGLWSAWSSERSFTVEPRIAYDFIEKAPTASWESGGWGVPDSVILSFPGSISDRNGFACYRTNIKLSDGATYGKILETHPMWVDNSWISGRYSNVYVPADAKLRVKVGIISGGAAGKVKFIAGKYGEEPLWNKIVAYGDGVKEAEFALGIYAGQTIPFVLVVSSEGSAAQDWAAWAEARIVY